MKKILALILCIATVFSLFACSAVNEENGGGTNESGNTASGSGNTSSGSGSTASGTEAGNQTGGSGNNSGANTNADNSTSGWKTLVVYYSATNNTEAIAGYIANATGADLFELIPTEPYTSDDLDWTDRNSRVSREHDDESLRAVELEKTVPDNWDEYDTVFIGYPIWWGIAAWPTDTFVKANDFTGKTVIPFCTSSSSGLGQSGELLRDEAGTGNWLEGQRFQSRASEDTVKEWVTSLGL